MNIPLAKQLRTLAIIVALTTLNMPSLLHAATTYYVATDGSDSHDGLSLKSPFRTIQKAADIMQPGDTCLIRGGVYREKIVPPRGGTSESSRITYRSYADEQPIIKGSEQVAEWTDLGGGVWKAVLTDQFFSSSPYNPFATKLSGLWMSTPGNQCSLGMLYVNGEQLSARYSTAEVQSTPKTWWAVQEKGKTILQANFDTDPNQAMVEVNVRDSCFHPGSKVLNYISLVGLTLSQAAPNGSGPIHPQQGIITVFAGKGWVIEDCIISDSPCSGIALATGPDTWYSPTSATQDSRGSVPDFSQSGFHVVRRNTIERCGQAGIIGMINGHSSLIEGNLIQDINVERNIGGAETAGIKLHWAIDTVIRHNIIRRVLSGKEAAQNFGVWLDFACQGARISGNVIYDINDPSKATPKCFPLYLEANVGPIVMDNNILIHPAKGPYNNELGSLHQVAAHNLVVEGRLMHFNDPSRGVPYYQPHSLKFTEKLDAAAASNKANWRYIDRNNLFIGPFSDQQDATESSGNVKFDWNALQEMQWKLADSPTGLVLEFQLSKEAHDRLTGGTVVRSADFGEFPLVKQRLEDRDGKPFDLDTDIAGNSRVSKDGTAVPGPFTTLRVGPNRFHFAAGKSAKEFVSSASDVRDPVGKEPSR
jgi:hypothetical protein